MNAKPVTCQDCGKEYPFDPALAVECPQCHAPAGRKCKRPSGHDCNLHMTRDALAFLLGHMPPCCEAVARRQREKDAPRQCRETLRKAGLEHLIPKDEARAEGPLFAGVTP